MAMYKIWAMGVAVIILLFSPQLRSEVLEVEKRGIKVSGTAVLRAVPDVVWFRVTIRSMEQKAVDASNRNSEIAKEIIRQLKDSGVDEKKIQTGWMELEPVYRERREVSSGIKAYMARSTLVVELDDVEKFDSIRIALLEKGASDIDGIVFKSSQQDELRRKARNLAVRAARKKAADIASELGVKVGDVLCVEEQAKKSWGSRSLVSNVIVEEAGAGEADVVQAAPSIARGQIEIKETVNIVFDIEYPE